MNNQLAYPDPEVWRAYGGNGFNIRCITVELGYNPTHAMRNNIRLLQQFHRLCKIARPF